MSLLYVWVLWEVWQPELSCLHSKHMLPFKRTGASMSWWAVLVRGGTGGCVLCVCVCGERSHTISHLCGDSYKAESATSTRTARFYWCSFVLKNAQSAMTLIRCVTVHSSTNRGCYINTRQARLFPSHDLSSGFCIKQQRNQTDSLFFWHWKENSGYVLECPNSL